MSELDRQIFRLQENKDKAVQQQFEVHCKFAVQMYFKNIWKQMWPFLSANISVASL